MASLNKILLIGNLTRDPELKYTPKGTAVCALGLAVNRKFTNERGDKQEEVTFVDVTLWGKTAEVCAQYSHKGEPLYVEGRLTVESWEDKNGGGKRSKTFVTADTIQFLGSKRSSPSAASSASVSGDSAASSAAVSRSSGTSPSADSSDDIDF